MKALYTERWSRVMRYVSATEFKRRFATALDAVQREPVVIHLRKRDVAVLVSIQEYERLQVLSNDDFQRFCDRIGERAATRGLTKDKLDVLLADKGQVVLS